MKNYEELTLKGQFARCEKALSILSSNVNCSTCVDKAYQYLYDCDDDGLDWENVNKLRNEILEANKYRGYASYCPLKEVKVLLY